MNKKQMVAEIEAFVKQQLQDDCTGHDWWHVDRVRKVALYIAKQEKADLFLVELVALLHDVDDWKFSTADETSKVNDLLAELGFAQSESEQIRQMISEVSFKGNQVDDSTTSLEAAIVQDADRIDALGAIGIARCFAYGGHKKQKIYNPDISVQEHSSFEEYKSKESTSINHFYEKLLLLKGRMKTETGKHIATKRHQLMQQYLDEFIDEWHGYTIQATPVLL